MNITTIIVSVTLSAAALSYVVYQNNQHQEVQAQLKQQIEQLNTQVDTLSNTKSTAVEAQKPGTELAVAKANQTAQSPIGSDTNPQPRDLANVDSRLMDQHNIKRIEELARQGKNPDVLFQKGKKKGEADL